MHFSYHMKGLFGSLILTTFFLVRGEKVIVTNDDSVLPCSGCSKSNSLLKALDNSFKSRENFHILLEDKSYKIDKEAKNLYNNEEPGRSTD